ncbi:MAG: putative transport permease YfiM [Herpetosiphonaceae bacterium]|nr:MAG: putative transport permease YfiM [Herpetosiphonaceae bacterium]
MPKFLSIAWKDLKITFRDRAALITMLLTPFALSLAVAAAFGGSGGGSTAGIRDIPVVIVNNDQGDLGNLIVEIFNSPELVDLLEPTLMSDEAAARSQLENGDLVSVIVIPPDFSERLSASQSANSEQPQGIVEVYTNVARPLSSGVVRDIINRVLSRLIAGSATVQLVSNQLVETDRIAPEQMAALAPELAQRARQLVQGEGLISVEAESVAGVRRTEFNWLAYMAPSMAILFLMFTVTNGGRSLLAERESGTLPRLLTTPTSAGQIIGGKVAGIYFTGLAQMGILLVASYVILGVPWGSILAVILVTLALVGAATGWGILLAAISRNAAQAGTIGMTIALVFAGLSGNFIPRQALPEFMRTASYISPNSWGLEAYSKLTSGGTLADVTTPLAALAAMALILFIISVVAFRRQSQ